MRGLITIQKGDNGYFRWCLFKNVNSVIKNSSQIGNADREFACQSNLKHVNYLFTRKFVKIEKQNNISINMFCYESKYYTIFILQNKLLKSISIYYWYKTKIHGKNNFVNIAYNASLAHKY